VERKDGEMTEDSGDETTPRKGYKALDLSFVPPDQLHWWINAGGAFTEVQPIEEIYPAHKIEAEEEKRERMWRAVQEFSST
jgi:hypothetical protein